MSWEICLPFRGLVYLIFSFSCVEFLFINSSWWKIQLPDYKWMMFDMSVVLPYPSSSMVSASCLATSSLRREISNPRLRDAAQRQNPSRPGVHFLGSIWVYFHQWLLEMRARKWSFWLQCTFMKCMCIPFLAFYVCLLHYHFRSCLSQKPLYLTIRSVTSEIRKRNAIIWEEKLFAFMLF